MSRRRVRGRQLESGAGNTRAQKRRSTTRSRIADGAVGVRQQAPGATNAIGLQPNSVHQEHLAFPLPRPSTAQTLIVAASDAPPLWRDTAHYRCDGTNDQEEIQRATDDAGDGGLVLLSAGTFHIGAAINLAGRLQGHGLGTVLISDGPHTLLNVDSTSNVTVADLRLRMGESGTGIAISSCDAVAIEGVTVNGGDVGVDATSSSRVALSSLHASSAGVADPLPQVGARINDCAYSTYVNCRLVGDVYGLHLIENYADHLSAVEMSGGDTDLRVDGGSDITVVGCFFEGFGQSIAFGDPGGGAGEGSGAAIVGNIVYGSVYIPDSWVRVAFSGNALYGDVTISADGAVVTSNTTLYSLVVDGDDAVKAVNSGQPPVVLSDQVPPADGSPGAAGDSDTAARADHKHPAVPSEEVLLTSPDGTVWTVTIGDDGELQAAGATTGLLATEGGVTLATEDGRQLVRDTTVAQLTTEAGEQLVTEAGGLLTTT